MCLVAYVGVRRQQAEIGFDSRLPAFNVRQVAEDEWPAMLAAIRMPYVYVVGAHTSCACGFMGGAEDDPADELDRRTSLGGLNNFIAAAAEDGDVVLVVGFSPLDEELQELVSEPIALNSIRDIDFDQFVDSGPRRYSVPRQL